MKMCHSLPAYGIGILTIKVVPFPMVDRKLESLLVFIVLVIYFLYLEVSYKLL
jgi:hypothetical protein